MKQLYEKSELGFALVWIGIYCVGMSVFDGISRKIGLENSVTAVFAAAVSLFLFVWLRKQGKAEYFGLCRPTAPAKAFLFYIPLIILTSKNLWGGAAMHYNAVGTLCFVAKMLCVGFLEELIFRGFLFKAMARDNIKTAVVVSSVTFGLGHIINLLNGSGMGVGENLTQIFFAVLIGFLYVIIFWRGGSLWPCIISHGVFNSLSAFSANGEATLHLVILCVLTAAYAAVLLKTLPKAKIS
ncbi:MAG: CPBP family intramembrane metalloprotease [Oscillospiraceae bacterium]|nr:CPBP family intramembrane metalloprotease [Oscillospiraceae bacterium]